MMEKVLIRFCPDIMRSLSMAEELKDEYRQQGYEVVDLILCFFKLMLDDGFVLVGWEDGAFYTQCFPY